MSRRRIKRTRKRRIRRRGWRMRRKGRRRRAFKLTPQDYSLQLINMLRDEVISQATEYRKARNTRCAWTKTSESPDQSNSWAEMVMYPTPLISRRKDDFCRRATARPGYMSLIHLPEC